MVITISLLCLSLVFLSTWLFLLIPVLVLILIVLILISHSSEKQKSVPFKKFTPKEKILPPQKSTSLTKTYQNTKDPKISPSPILNRIGLLKPLDSSTEPGANLWAKYQEIQTNNFTEEAPLKIKPAALPWYKGYLAEKFNGDILNQLKLENWGIYHSVELGYDGKIFYDLDHLLISPSGKIFVLNSKNVEGKNIEIYPDIIFVDEEDYGNKYMKGLYSYRKSIRFDQKNVWVGIIFYKPQTIMTHPYMVN